MRRFLVAGIVAAVLVPFVAFVGQSSEPPPEPPVEHVVVQEGEGLWSVARRLCPDNIGAQFDVLQRANPWYTVGLHPGTVLHVPAGSCPEPPTATTTTTTTTSPSSTTSTTVITVPPPPDGFPTAATVGVPAGWTPVQTINGTHRVTQAGAVVEDLRINGSLLIQAPNVTVRRVEVVGGIVDNRPGSTCNNGFVLEDSTVRRGSSPTQGAVPRVGTGGYTARRVLIEDVPEGFRAGGASSGGCGPVLIEDSYVRVVSPDVCGDWHGDGIQGYDGPPLTVRNTVLVMVERAGCGGTAPFFVPGNQGNDSAVVDGLVVEGGGFSFRMGVPGSVRNLHVVESSWGFGPVDVNCGVLTAWQASISRLDAAGQPQPVRAANCTGDGL